tara:strand:- start:1249 stop:2073 length:825 start_codon:yes stop_codon:yes gene_type:complete
MRRRAIVPARINIIGEHTDYSGGLSLPFALDCHLTVEAVEREEGFTGDEIVIQLWKSSGGWPADISIKSNIPIGKGMSSSAALCVGIVLCSQGNQVPLQVAQEAQRIEHEILGTPCGLLDQLAMLNAKKGHISLIDFSNLNIKSIPLPENWHFKLVDSNIHRDLSSTDYGANSTELNRHVMEENIRVNQSINASPEELGGLLNQTHSSLISLGVSLPEIDKKLESIRMIEGVLGARMMGGGFGGMLLVLVNDSDVLPDYPLLSSSGPAVLEEFL